MKPFAVIVMGNVAVRFSNLMWAERFMRGYRRALTCDEFIDPPPVLTGFEKRGFLFCHRVRFYCRRHDIPPEKVFHVTLLKVAAARVPG